MKTVYLYTRSREYVATIEVPPFKIMPEIIIWGQRFFCHWTDDAYVEGMAWYHTSTGVV